MRNVIGLSGGKDSTTLFQRLWDLDFHRFFDAQNRRRVERGLPMRIKESRQGEICRACTL